MALRPLAPEASASANSATSARGEFVQGQEHKSIAPGSAPGVRPEREAVRQGASEHAYGRDDAVERPLPSFAPREPVLVAKVRGEQADCDEAVQPGSRRQQPSDPGEDDRPTELTSLRSHGNDARRIALAQSSEHFRP